MALIHEAMLFHGGDENSVAFFHGQLLASSEDLPQSAKDEDLVFEIVGVEGSRGSLLELANPQGEVGCSFLLTYDPA